MNLFLTGLILSIIFVNTNTSTMANEIINTGKWTEEQINSFLKETKDLDYSKKVDYISRLFLGTPYNDRTLIGNENSKEVFVINLSEVDCFTYIDYVLALTISKTFSEFRDNLMKVRYKEGVIDFKHRRHFFTDWTHYEPSFVRDITPLVGKGLVKKEAKLLNTKGRGKSYLPGLPLVKRTIQYIPSHVVNKGVLSNLQTGDYIGIYSKEKGLDVSHVGILIKTSEGKTLFRHASSVRGRVVEQDFLGYISKMPGIVVLRHKNLELTELSDDRSSSR